MSAVHTVEGAVVRVVGGGGVVMLTDNPRSGGPTLLSADALELVALLDRTLELRASGAAFDGTLLGSFSAASGGYVHILAFSNSINVHDSPDPHGHSGWTFRFEDQVIALRDAIRAAIGSASTQPGRDDEAEQPSVEDEPPAPRHTTPTRARR
jgi:hypothetical protein